MKKFLFTLLLATTLVACEAPGLDNMCSYPADEFRITSTYLSKTSTSNKYYIDYRTSTDYHSVTNLNVTTSASWITIYDTSRYGEIYFYSDPTECIESGVCRTATLNLEFNNGYRYSIKIREANKPSYGISIIQ